MLSRRETLAGIGAAGLALNLGGDADIFDWRSHLLSIEIRHQNSFRIQRLTLNAFYDSTVLVDCMDITNQAQRRCALPFVELAFPYEFELIRQRAIYDNALGARVHLSFFCVHYKRAIGSDVAET